MRPLTEAIQKYRSRFGESPPVWGIAPDEAVKRIEAALKSGEPMTDGIDEISRDDTQ